MDKRQWQSVAIVMLVALLPAALETQDTDSAQTVSAIGYASAQAAPVFKLETADATLTPIKDSLLLTRKSQSGACAVMGIDLNKRRTEQAVWLNVPRQHFASGINPCGPAFLQRRQFSPAGANYSVLSMDGSLAISPDWTLLEVGPTALGRKFKLNGAAAHMQPKLFLWQKSRRGNPLVIAFQERTILLCELDLRAAKVYARTVFTASSPTEVPTGTATANKYGTVFYTSTTPGEEDTRVLMLDAGSSTLIGTIAGSSTASTELVGYID